MSDENTVVDETVDEIVTENAEQSDAADASTADESGQEADTADTDADSDDEDDDEDDAEDDAEGDAEGEAASAPARSKRDEALTNEGEIAADYIEGLLDIADLDGDIDTYNEGGRAHISILTDAEMLVGRNGEVLEALQELARLAVMTETGHRSRLMLDIAGHREKRRGQLLALATDAVADVQRTGESVRLSPMNPFERKIVHDVIAGAGLVSESEGEEPNRRVVVMPKA